MEKVINDEYGCTVHKFYCDKCNRLLYQTDSINDYVEAGDFLVEEEVVVFSTVFKIKKNMCNSCAEKFKERFLKTLEEFGFEEKSY